MTDKHILYGAEFSLYSGKARCYLRYKKIPFDEVLSSLSVYKETIIPNTGVRFIPVVKTPAGCYLQDTSHIIDSLEKSFPMHSVMPDTPNQRLAALLLELYGDEWLLMPAMHYRWNFDNFPFIFDEFLANVLVPGFVASCQCSGLPTQIEVRWKHGMRKTFSRRLTATSKIMISCSADVHPSATLV